MVTRLHGRMVAVLAGAAACFAFSSSPVLAQQGTIYVQVPQNLRIERVGYGDLDLATRAGGQTLRRRISDAIGDVCLEDRGRWYGLSEPDYNQCVWGAWQRARPQMIGAVYRARRLTFYHASRLAYYRGY